MMRISEPASLMRTPRSDRTVDTRALQTVPPPLNRNYKRDTAKYVE